LIFVASPLSTQQ